MLLLKGKVQFKKKLLVKKDGKRFYFVCFKTKIGKKIIESDLLFSYSPSIKRVMSKIKTATLKEIGCM